MAISTTYRTFVSMNRVELLAPAKNLACGIEAILHGADAVYIGAPKYSARSAAGNTIEDIEKLVTFAHQYHARVYVALNTLLTDAELAEAEQLIHDLHRIGVDALIVQDTGIFNLNLPPIAIHSSTQADNRTAEKVRFWQEVGCEQVVLARELSLEQITAIAEQTNVRLEAFVHGALCVSYSGQCYASQALCGRSANRGQCAQVCRLPFDLQDSQGHSLGKKHWLSLKDFDLSNHVGDMLDAGIRSFKIEGRLKEVEYVKNLTAYYRKKIDDALQTRPHLTRLSDGESRITFTPHPQKTFHRGATTYFFNGRSNDIYSFQTPKSIGEYIGTVKRILPKGFVLSYALSNTDCHNQNRSLSEVEGPVIHNGDGLCFFTPDGELVGCKVNKVENGVILPNGPVALQVGDAVYRNADEQFLHLLQKPSAVRKIGVQLCLTEQTLTATDGKFQSSVTLSGTFENSKTSQTENYQRILGKLGDTVFDATDICIDTAYFIPSSVLTNARREVMEQLALLRLQGHPAPLCLPKQNNYPFPLQHDSYLNNIANAKAKAFYAQHGAPTTQMALEVKDNDDATLMFCKHCIKFALGACPKQKTAVRLSEPLFLIHKNYYLKLSFNCKDCMMEVRKG